MYTQGNHFQCHIYTYLLARAYQKFYLFINDAYVVVQFMSVFDCCGNLNHCIIRATISAGDLIKVNQSTTGFSNIEINW